MSYLCSAIEDYCSAKRFQRACCELGNTKQYNIMKTKKEMVLSILKDQLSAIALENKKTSLTVNELTKFETIADALDSVIKENDESGKINATLLLACLKRNANFSTLRAIAKEAKATQFFTFTFDESGTAKETGNIFSVAQIEKSFNSVRFLNQKAKIKGDVMTKEHTQLIIDALCIPAEIVAKMSKSTYTKNLELAKQLKIEAETAK